MTSPVLPTGRSFPSASTIRTCLSDAGTPTGMAPGSTSRSGGNRLKARLPTSDAPAQQQKTPSVRIVSRASWMSARCVGSPQVDSSRRDSTASSADSSPSQDRSSDGVQCAVVASCATSQSRSPVVVRRRTSQSSMVDPLSKLIASASRPPPKLRGSRTTARSSGRMPRKRRPSRAWLTGIFCASTTPLGVPVEPEVNSRTAGSSGPGWSAIRV